MTASITTRTCPDCGAAFDSDPRFTEWCPSCEWNLGTEPPESPRTARRRARERALAERSHARSAAKAANSGRWSAREVAASALAALVHLVTLAVVACSVWLLLTGNLLFILLGVTGLGLAYLLRPRLGGGRRPDDAEEVSREAAPQLYALTDRIAGELGVRRADRIRVQSGYRTGYARLGVRQEVELTIGMALWTVLTPQERIALLGQELAHGGNRDPRRGLWLRLALDTLDAWYGLLMPGHGDELRSAQFDDLRQYDAVPAGGVMRQVNATAQKAMLEGLTVRVLLLCAQPVRLARSVLRRLTLSGSQEAEFRADDLAARAGSSRATVAMLDMLFLDESATAYLRQQRALVGHGRAARPADLAEALWSGLAGYLDTVPDIERERRRRLAARRAVAVDAWHPPTHLRLQLQAGRPEQPAAVAADAVDWPAVHAELEDARWRTAILLLGI
ncbi:M48 family metallopeptidase [Kitasatospora sp. NBC_01287]|uniref:M48 family metallopeptidase n=1 Tax=Kitasatospora sp. NBC_01287 TaxID=2903573 RepID=UPI0022541839|nr:M48 family metallopeptidase [Kitasatospora sp. NBC_01287]MCX4744044.1 M48 family metallopeptidase [Kitasatospora sp. NBC_01287]